MPVEVAVVVAWLSITRVQRRRQLFVLQSDLDVQRVSFFQVGHQRLRAERPDDMKWSGPTSPKARQPASEPQIGNPRRVVRMIVRQEHCIDLGQRHITVICRKRTGTPRPASNSSF